MQSGSVIGSRPACPRCQAACTEYAGMQLILTTQLGGVVRPALPWPTSIYSNCLAYKHSMVHNVTGEGGIPHPSTLALAGASHIARQRLRPVLRKKCELPPPYHAQAHTKHAPHTHTPTAARARLPDVPPSYIHPLACHPVLSCLIRPAKHSPLPSPIPSPPQELRARRRRRRSSSSHETAADSIAAGAVQLDHSPSPRLIPANTYIFHALPCHTIPYCTRLHHTIPYHTIPYHTIHCLTPHHTMPCHTMPYHTMPCYAIPYCAILYHTIPCHTILSPYRTTLHRHT